MSSSRLLLWRRAIYLFDETARGHWQGPFATAGYRWPLPDHPPYIVSRRVLDFEGHDLTPDIVSASSQHWAVLELTLHPSSKAADMAKYARINPGSFSNYGLNCPKVEPDLIVGRIGPFDDGPYAQVLLGPTLHTERIADIKDPLLREALRAAEGTDLAHIPEIPVAFLPESRGPELRQGLVDLVMALFRPERPAVSPAEFVERGLERMSAGVSIEDKKRLIENVGRELRTLTSGPGAPLAGDIEFKDGYYRARDGVTWHSKTLERMKRGLESWAKGGTTARTASLDGPTW